MRKMLPIVLLLVGFGCSLPKRHDENLVKKPGIPLVEEAPTAPPLNEGSLWRDHSLIGDLRASRINDLVTLKISEATSAIAKADVTTSRAGTNSVSASFPIGGRQFCQPDYWHHSEICRCRGDGSKRHLHHHGDRSGGEGGGQREPHLRGFPGYPVE